MDRGKNSSFFLFLLALAILYGSARLGLGTVGAPGPGFLPFWGAAVLSLTSGIESLLKVASRSKQPKDSPRRVSLIEIGWRKILYVILALTLYTLFLDIIGFVLCTFLLMILLLTVIEARRWHTLLIESFLITLVSYIVFEKALTVGFPKGVFGF